MIANRTRLDSQILDELFQLIRCECFVNNLFGATFDFLQMGFNNITPVSGRQLTKQEIQVGVVAGWFGFGAEARKPNISGDAFAERTMMRQMFREKMKCLNLSNSTWDDAGDCEGFPKSVIRQNAFSQ